MTKILPVLLFLMVLIAPATVAQEWSADQQAVWKVVDWTWEVDNTNWCESLCHENLMAWDKQNPAPRNRDQTRTWQKKNLETSKAVANIATPISIVVQGDVAVAHYYYSSMSEDSSGKRETEHGRYTDVLIKEAGKWVYITWSGGADN